MITGLFVDITSIYKALRPRRLDYNQLTREVTNRYGKLGLMKAYITDSRCPAEFKRVLRDNGYELVLTTENYYNWTLQIAYDVLAWSKTGDRSIVVSNDPQISLIADWHKRTSSHKLVAVGTNLTETTELLVEDYFYIEEGHLLR
jgi:hypothetical protein